MKDMATELSKYVWTLKHRNINHDIKWRKVKQTRSYSTSTKTVTCVHGRNTS